MAGIERKIAIMGYRSVGKSSLTIQFVQKQFVDSYDPTIENTFPRPLKFRNREYNLQLVDTAGQDEFSIFPRSYATDVHGYVLVYAINSQKSFNVVKAIHDKILDHVGTERVPLVLVGNKVDLRLEREVQAEEGQKLANSWKAAFVEVSAREFADVQGIFEKVVLEIERAQGNIRDAEPGNKCRIS